MMRRWHRAFWAVLLVFGLGLLQAASAEPASPAPDAPAQAPPSSAPSAAEVAQAKIEAALDNALTLQRSGQVGLATIWDGNKFVQCRRTRDASITCEAAGTALQPSLAHVLTLDRAFMLFQQGWAIDVHFGSYLRLFPDGTSTKAMARQILRALDEGYGADLAALSVRTTWVRDTACPPRNGPGQNLAGSIDDAAAMARTAIRTCTYAPAVKAALNMRSVAEFLGLYGQRVKGEIQRLIVNSSSTGIHLVLAEPSGYVQCAPETAPPAIYCEAASADAMPGLAKVLTPERITELHGFGFADPGRGPNYFRSVPLDKADARLLTLDLLSILFDVYGYRGCPILKIATEKGG